MTRTPGYLLLTAALVLTLAAQIPRAQAAPTPDAPSVSAADPSSTPTTSAPTPVTPTPVTPAPGPSTGSAPTDPAPSESGPGTPDPSTPGSPAPVPPGPPGTPGLPQPPSSPAESGTDPTARIIVKFRSGADAGVRRRTLDRAERRVGSDLDEQRTLATGATLVDSEGRDPVTVAREIEAQPEVEYAVPDGRMFRTATPTDPRFPEQWGLQTADPGIDVPTAWEQGRGAGAVVAVVDTGRTAHPELAGQFIGGYDFISEAPYARDGDGRDSNPQDEGDWLTGTPDDLACDGRPRENSSWHGTHVAGIVAAKSDQTGITGVAPAARVVPVRVLGLCGGLFSDIIDGMLWAAGAAVPGVPANPHPARVVNLSLGARAGCDPAMQDAISQLRQRGALPVVAAGNAGADVSTHTPANCRGSFTVAALTQRGGRASYSNNGSLVAIAAPGDRILSTVNGGTQRPTNAHTYALASGTSMAAPHVAGTAALVLSKNPALTVDDLHSILLRATDPFLDTCSGCGRGMLDAATAMRLTPAPLPYRKHLDVSPSGVSAVRTADGTIWAFARLGSQIAYRTQARSGASWTGWTTIPGAVTSAPAVVSHDGRVIDLFVRGPGNQLLHTYTSSGRFVSYRDRGGILTSAPAVASLGTRQFDILVRSGNADGLYRRTIANGSWGGWQFLGGNSLTTAPSAVADRARGIVQVEARGGNGIVYGLELSRTGVARNWTSRGVESRTSTAFAQPGPLGVWLTTSWVGQSVLRTGTVRLIDGRPATGGPAVAQHTDGTNVILVRSTDNALWCWDSRTSTWSSLGGTLT